MIYMKLLYAVGTVIKRSTPLCTVLLAGVITLSCTSTLPAPISVISIPEPQQTPDAGLSDRTEAFISSQEPGWQKVAVMTNENAGDCTFFITSPVWRIRWNMESVKAEYSSIDMLIYISGRDNMPYKHISSSGAEPGQPVYLERGNEEFRVKVAAANVTGWTVIIEEPAGENQSHPVQITRIQYRGHIYENSNEEAPVPEADEYVEITNRGTETVPLSGWKLINANRSNLLFVFPSYFPYICGGEEIEELIEEGFPPLPCILKPFHSVRVYTFYHDSESGGLSFYYAPGNIWNNDTPDTAVLYSSSGKEISRRSYQVYPDDYHAIEKPPVASAY